MGGPAEHDTNIFIQNTARQLRARLHKSSGQMAKVMPDYRRSYGPALKVVRDFEVCNAPSEAAFSLDRENGIMLLNANHIGGVLNVIEAFSKSGAHPTMLEGGDLDDLRRSAVELFILHELRHISQGIPDFKQVQMLKVTEGAHFIAKLDLEADNLAARTWAWLSAVEDGNISPANFIFYYFNALAFICGFCLPAFGAPSSKPAKVARALGLHIMLARLTLARVHFGPAEAAPDFPLDTPLMPSLSEGFDTMSLVAYTPEMVVKVAGYKCDPKIVQSFVDHVADGDFWSAFGIAKVLAAKLLSAAAASAIIDALAPLLVLELMSETTAE